MTINGTCLCGQVKATLDNPPDEQTACHCTDCQRICGAPFGTAIVVPRSDYTLSGPVKTYIYKLPSGNEVERTFCDTCGATIGMGGTLFEPKFALYTGIFLDHFSKTPIVEEIFVKDRWSSLSAIEGAAQYEKLQTKPH